MLNSISKSKIRPTGHDSSKYNAHAPVRALFAPCVSPIVIRRSASAFISRAGAPRAQRVVVSVAGPGVSGGAQDVDALRAELKTLEEERAEAIQAAEACARAGVKLAEMVKLLEQLALERVKHGDEAGARQALEQKASAKEALEKNGAKADANFGLAQRLLSRISDKQAALLTSLRQAAAPGAAPAPAPAPATSAPAATPSATPSPRPGSGAYSSNRDYSGSAGSSGSSSTYSGLGGGGTGDSKWQWQASLDAARERVKQQEEEALRAGRTAKLNAEASILRAQERLRMQAAADERLEEARRRVKDAEAAGGGSLEAARERIRARDDEVLEYVRRVMARYRRGEYVSEDELEFAFTQLEKRFLL